jgi:methionyl-tRNA formyltransferase
MDRDRTERPRIVVYCVEPFAYRLLRTWAEGRGYRFALIVTSPGPKRARSVGYREIIAAAPPEQDILVTTDMRGTAPLIAALAPDVVLSFTLPFRLPPEILALPRHGAVNLHPSPLPAYRGPNPARSVYNGEPMLGATLHRTAAEYDTGPILSSHLAPLPDDVSPESIRAVWSKLILQALDAGFERALADEPGEPQDDARASYAASFTPEETWLDWNLPAMTLQYRATALNLLKPQAMARINGDTYLVERLQALSDGSSQHPPGTVLDSSTNTLTVQTGHGTVRVTAISISAS